MARTQAARDPLIGTTFEGRYRLDRLLGRGGFGAVYLGTQLTIGRPVAIKILRPELAASHKEVARFQQEARAMAAIQHPNVVVVYDFGQSAEGSLFLVTEYLDGEPLSVLLKRESPLSPARVTNLALQVLKGLALAHEANVVHRDLKPENLFIISRGGERDVVKILDFGIAKVVGEQAASVTLTQVGQTLGSPRYMSPEQARSQPVSPQSDLYSLGVILWEALTARPLFESESATGYLMAHIREPAPPLERDGMLLQGPLADLIMACLEKEPELRPANAAEAIARLTTRPATRPAPPPTARPVRQREPTLDAPLVTGRHAGESAVGSIALVQPARYQQRETSNPLLWAMPLAILLIAGAGFAGWYFTLGPGSTWTQPASAAHTTTPVVTPAAAVADATDGEDEADAAVADEDTVIDLAGESAEVRSEPSGATVAWGDEVLGDTPVTVTWAPGEVPAVTLTLEGYEPASVALGDDVAGGFVHVALAKTPRSRRKKKKKAAEAVITRSGPPEAPE